MLQPRLLDGALSRNRAQRAFQPCRVRLCRWSPSFELPKHSFCNYFVKVNVLLTYACVRDLRTAEGDTGAVCSLLQHFL